MLQFPTEEGSLGTTEGEEGKGRGEREGKDWKKKKTLHIIEEDRLQFRPLSDLLGEACQLIVGEVDFLLVVMVRSDCD